MAVRVLNFAGYVCVFAMIIQFSGSNAMISTPDINPHHPKAIADLKEAIVKGLGLQSDDLKISGFDSRDALVGRSVAYEFDVEIDNKVLPFKLLEDVHRWEYVDLPIFRVEDQVRNASDENGLVEKKGSEESLPVLAPFQLAGPMELWIQDAKNMRISLPHDVDAGELRKVILADGAIVMVKGARSVSLRHPIELPLPLNNTQNGFASGLLTLAERLQHASRTQTQLLSLRIVGPTSLTSPTPSSPSSKNKLKLKRIAPGLVELSSVPKTNSKNALSTIDLHQDAPTLLTPNHFTTLWPITSLNGSHSNLLGLEKLLISVLGSKASQDGSFKLLKADMSAQTYVKIDFKVEKKWTGNLSSWEAQARAKAHAHIPEWGTKPETMKMHFEVLAKVDGDKFVPERVMRVNPVPVEHTVAASVVTRNATMSKVPVLYTPFSPFAL